ncbi:MAG: hypothetical protein ACRDS9_15490 [Pseudonocardiaceae bacterium]
MTATTTERGGKCSTAEHFRDVGAVDERLRGSEGFAIRVTDDDPGPPLPSGVFHLVIADTDLSCPVVPGGYLTVCGRRLDSGNLPPAVWDLPDDDVTDPRYCRRCAAEATRWIAPCPRT